MTNKQKQILDLLKNNIGHYTADEVFFLAKKHNIDVSLASVYRILNSLAENGLIRRVSNIMSDKDVYDAFIDEHEHLVCSKCGKITDIKIKDLKKSLEKQTGVTIDSFDLCIRYVCDDCKNEK